MEDHRSRGLAGRVAQVRTPEKSLEATVSLFHRFLGRQEAAGVRACIRNGNMTYRYLQTNTYVDLTGEETNVSTRTPPPVSFDCF